jgi:hypothetical protein
MVASSISETTLLNYPSEVPRLEKKELITALTAKYSFISFLEHNTLLSCYGCYHIASIDFD